MKRMLWAAAFSAAIVMTGCGDKGEDKAGAPVDATPTEGRTEAEIAAGPSTTAPSAGTPAPAAAGAPEYAVIYPGGEAKGEATPGMSPAGPGGILSFTTDASPDQVVEFYRQRADAAGLRPINSLNSDGARGYSAGDGGNRLLNVVATPVVDGPTDVLLSWTGG
ncbi:hypothetical protein [Brevundimonas sp. FT23042]|uniref:hypothetical protein n=1 Tax=Brevundimonas sp. FT23042 TaxID=3393749 RepID=UPI003B587B89